MREASATPSDLRIVQRVFGDIEPEFLGFFATEIAKAEKSIALVARLACGHVFFAQHPAAGKDMNALLKEVLAKVGGKGGGTRDFARGRLEDPAQAEKTLAFAKELLIGDKPAV